jgi:tetratricopeptide (TPR) repeat protein
MRSFILAIVFLSALPSAFAQAPDLESARQHFQEGTAAFGRGDYPTAEREFRAAFGITKDPLLLYNIGQSQQRRGNLEDAVKSYKAYLAGVPDADDKAEVQALIAKLEKDIASPRVTPPDTKTPGTTPPVEPTSQPSEEGSWKRPTAWIVGGLSVALLGVGGAMSGLSSSKAGSANELQDRRVNGQPVSFSAVASEYNAAKDDASKFGKIAVAMYIAGGVGAILTTYFFVTSRSKSVEKPEARLRIVPALSANSAGLVAGVEF